MKPFIPQHTSFFVLTLFSRVESRLCLCRGIIVILASVMTSFHVFDYYLTLVMMELLSRT